MWFYVVYFNVLLAFHRKLHRMNVGKVYHFDLTLKFNIIMIKKFRHFKSRTQTQRDAKTESLDLLYRLIIFLILRHLELETIFL